MIGIVGTANWFFMPLRPTKFAPAKLAKVKVVDGRIVSGFTRERGPGVPARGLHWAEGIGSWVEGA